MNETMQPAVAGPVEPTVRKNTERAKRAAAFSRSAICFDFWPDSILIIG